MSTNNKEYSANMWGKTWTIISLVIMLLAAAALFVAKPWEQTHFENETEKMTVDSLNSDKILNE
jgi:uncharacterized protein YpmS